MLTDEMKRDFMTIWDGLPLPSSYRALTVEALTIFLAKHFPTPDIRPQVDAARKEIVALRKKEREDAAYWGDTPATIATEKALRDCLAAFDRHLPATGQREKPTSPEPKQNPAHYGCNCSCHRTPGAPPCNPACCGPDLCYQPPQEKPRQAGVNPDGDQCLSCAGSGRIPVSQHYTSRCIECEGTGRKKPEPAKGEAGAGLLPCPRCAGPATVVRGLQDSWAICSDERCLMRGPPRSDDQCAAEAWNQRRARASLAIDEKALKAATEAVARALESDDQLRQQPLQIALDVFRAAEKDAP